jgi:DNA-binding IclR family transcriptional regulator
MQYSVRVGSQFPALEASSGVVLLAFASRTVVDSAIADLSETAQRAMLRRIESVRQTGSERIGSSVVSGIVNLSAPVFDHRDCAVAALTVPYLGQRYARTSVEAAQEKLVAEARRLSTTLGATVPKVSGRQA